LAAPQGIADMIGLIEELFSSENWRSLLKKSGGRLESAWQSSGADLDLKEEVA